MMYKMPLVISRGEYEKILSHLTCDEGERAEAEQYRKRLEHLTQASKHITHAWPDSVANITKKNEQIRAQKAEKLNIKDIEFYKKYMSDLKEDKERLLEMMRLKQFKDTDAPKTLLSGFILSDVLRDRALQIVFNNERQAEATAREKEYANDLRDKCNKWREREKLRAVCRKIKFIEDAKELKRQADEVNEKQRHENQQVLEMELSDIAVAAQQIREIKLFEDELAMKERKRILTDRNISHEMFKKKQKEVAITENLDEKLRNIYLQSKNRIDCIRKRKEAEFIEEKRKLANAMGDKLCANTKLKHDTDVEISQKNIERLAKKEQMRREADDKKKQTLIKEVQLAQKQFLQDRRQQRLKADTLAAWEMINSIKNIELTEQFYKEEKMRKLQKEKALQSELLEQQEEKRLREQQERAAVRKFYGTDMQLMLHNMDTATLQHASALLDECHRTKRPDYPVRKLHQKYKKAVQLNPPPLINEPSLEK